MFAGRVEIEVTHPADKSNIEIFLSPVPKQNGKFQNLNNVAASFYPFFQEYSC